MEVNDEEINGVSKHTPSLPPSSSSSPPPSPLPGEGEEEGLLLKKLLEQNKMLEEDVKFTTSSPSSNLRSSLPPDNLTPSLRCDPTPTMNSELSSDSSRSHDQIEPKGSLLLGTPTTTPPDTSSVTTPPSDLCTDDCISSSVQQCMATPLSDDLCTDPVTSSDTTLSSGCATPTSTTNIDDSRATPPHATPSSEVNEIPSPFPSPPLHMMMDSPTEVLSKPIPSSYSPNKTTAPSNEDTNEGLMEGEGLGPGVSIVLEEDNLDTLIPYDEVMPVSEGLMLEDHTHDDDRGEFDLESRTLSPAEPSHITSTTPSSIVQEESMDVLTDLPVLKGPSPPDKGGKRLRSETESKSMKLSLIPFKTRKRSHTIQEGGGAKEKDDGQEEKVHTSEEVLWQQWSDILKNWEEVSLKNNKLVKQLAHQGVPEHLRGMAWQLLSNSINLELKEMYPVFIIETSPHERAIRRDLNRTFPEHTFFKERDGLGQESLFNVLKAYSLYDKEVGYCQGSPFIAGLLLMQMPEEEAFCVLVRLMNNYKLREMYKPSMAELSICFYQLDKLVEEYFPPLWMHFKAVGFQTSMFASPWFLTLFASVLSLDTVFRVMDILLVNGREIIFLVGLALLETSHDSLVHMDMEDMIKHFQKELKVLHEGKDEELISKALKFKLNTKKMKKFAKEYSEKKARKALEISELGRLQNENMDLNQKLIQVQQEFDSLMEQLINGQITRAQEAEEMLFLRKELSITRKKLVKLEKQEMPDNCRHDNDDLNSIPDWVESTAGRAQVKLPSVSNHGNSSSHSHSDKSMGVSPSPTMSPTMRPLAEDGEEEKYMIYNSFDSRDSMSHDNSPYIMRGQLQGAGSKENLFIDEDTPQSSPSLLQQGEKKKKKKKKLLRRSKSEGKEREFCTGQQSCDLDPESTGYPPPPPLASPGAPLPPSPSGGSSGGKKEAKKKKKKEKRNAIEQLERELVISKTNCADYANQMEQKSLQLSQALQKETILIRELKQVKQYATELENKISSCKCQVQGEPPQPVTTSEEVGPNSTQEYSSLT